MKKALAISLICILILTCLAGLTGVAETQPDISHTSGDYTYCMAADGTAQITGYTGTSEDLVIPNTLDGVPVSCIGEAVFFNNQTLASVTIPEGISKIQRYAFAECPALNSVEFPHSLDSIGDYAFYNCVSLPSITIPEGITRIEEYAFSECTYLAQVTLPDTLSAIGKFAFDGCTMLNTVQLPANLAIIEDYLFSECSALYSLTLPDSIAGIGEYAFYNCGSLTSLRIPEGTTYIGENAFYGCASDLAVFLPNSLESIGNQALVTYRDEGSASIKAIVPHDSYAEQYCRDNSIDYLFEEDIKTTDWLGNRVSETIELPYRTNPTEKRTIEFNTELFLGYTKMYDKDLVKLSVLLSTAAYDESNVQCGTAICNAYKALGIAENDIMLFNYTDHPLNNPNYTKEDNRLFSIANRKMGDYILLFITLRGSGDIMKGSKDWADNFNVLYKQATISGMDVPTHPGFTSFAWDVQKGLSDYLTEHEDVRKAKKENKLKILLTGHSLGGATANLVAAYFMSDMFNRMNPMDLFVYTFATPRVFHIKDDKTPKTTDCANIHNIVIGWDPVPKMPTDERIDIWRRFGKTYIYHSTYPWYTISFKHHEMKNYIDAVFDHGYEKTQAEEWHGVTISYGPT